MARIIKGKSLTKHYPKTASTTFSAGSVVYLTSGKIDNVDSSTEEPLGIVQEAVDSTSDDYASTNKIAVRVPLDATTEIEMDVTNGLDPDADYGSDMEFSKTNPATVVNADGTTTGSVLCVGYISTSKGRFVFKKPHTSDAIQ